MSDMSLGPVYDYYVDAWQRSILFLDILRERGNTCREKEREEAPNVLHFDTELVMDGRQLDRPVNYGLVRIIPPDAVVPDPRKRPFVVVDPRAGHGPGIGGMKEQSEIGLALEAGHPCYFIGFVPKPQPGQTIEDVWNAEAAFISEVARRHPEADGKPVVIANCQAGWQTAIMASTNPEIPGPLMLVGAPLSCWSGVHGKNPMRYLGGLLGGTWLTRMAGDMGDGIFDGANLVANFESMNLGNTLWQKPYSVFAKADTEGERFLSFEEWWGSPVLLNAEEIEWITDNLFVGNLLTRGKLQTSDGLQIDLRNIQSPIICFCSWGDDISPPQQCLHWIADIYSDERQIVANGQTIVYTLHDSIGHLGIFVSGSVASKEHGEFINCMDMIDLLPPGLYEAVIEEVPDDTQNPELVQGRYLFSIQRRTVDDIRALGENSLLDDMRFETVRRISEVNRRLYETYVGPFVRAFATKAGAELTRETHPHRLRFGAFSDENPMMRFVPQAAASVRENRRPVREDNPLLALEKLVSRNMVSWLDAVGAARDAMSERLFLATYGSPMLHALVGLDKEDMAREMQVRRDPVREEVQRRQRKELDDKFEQGGPIEAALRAICFVMVQEDRIDERSYRMLQSLRETQPVDRPRSLAQLKAVLRDQSLLVRIDEERALATLPSLLPEARNDRQKVLRAVHRMVHAQGELSPTAKLRMERVERLFGGGTSDDVKSPAKPEPAAV